MSLMIDPFFISRQTAMSLLLETIMIASQLMSMTPFVLVFLMLTLKIFHTFFSVPIADFEQINVSWFIY